MKKVTYLVAALALASSTAMASKARRLAIANSTLAAGGVDVQEMFTNPQKLTKIPDMVTLEGGALAAGGIDGNAASTTPAMEGGFVDSIGDSKLSVYLGRDGGYSASAAGYQNIANYATGANYFFPNPIDVLYAAKGDLAWGLGFEYGSFDVKSGTATKGSMMNLSAGLFSGPHSLGLVQGLGTTIETPASGVKGTGTARTEVYYSYKISDNGKFVAQYLTSGIKKETNGTENKKFLANTTVVGYEGKKGAMFYGVQYSMLHSEDSATGTNVTTDTNTMPLWIGVEADAASWLVLRGSVKQNVLLGSTKVSTNSDADTIADNTAVAMGVGLKFDKFMLDGSLESGFDANGKFGLDSNMLYNTALTYMF